MKRVALFTMIGTYSISAGGAILAIFAGADWWLIGTASILGTFSLVVLGSLTVASMRYGRFLGFAAIASALAATLTTLGLIWGIGQAPSPFGGESLTLRVFVNVTICTWVYASCLMFSCLAVAAAASAGRVSRALAMSATGLNVLVSVLFTISYFVAVGGGYHSVTLLEGLWKSTLALSILGSLAVVVCLTVSLIQKTTKRLTVSLPPLSP
ncbi:hypothetical protein Lxx23530 [Leifsonia xyli subsp. xyli str. CTCB07]|uniref:Uncharacterized protein n=1 Tax=Leifsonia xyli subsp. xyli (strain CTCB07) TaxID=281090 RepID=Q6AC95_LEIXX|nr:hypothetical protein Lxx23530 [Leifsonia xyli subsp. xyli str. CTCB07]